MDGKGYGPEGRNKVMISAELEANCLFPEVIGLPEEWWLVSVAGYSAAVERQMPLKG